MKVPISRPYFGDEEREAILEVLESGWVVQGPKVAEFERRFAEYIGAPVALATSSCTTALHLALISLGIGPGDEVIVPAFTWVATANVVEMQGARPVFVDIELSTYNIDVTLVEAAVTRRTKAIMPVSLFGISAPMDEILAIARAHGLRVVEDAACALGARYHGHHAGTLADIGCFSFHPRKAITTGEGGMLITGSQDIAEMIHSLRDHGTSHRLIPPGAGSCSYLLPDFDVLGYNYRMTDLQAALGVAQMTRAEWLLQERTRRAQTYDEELGSLGWLRLPAAPDGCRHGYQSYVCLYQPEPPTLENVDRLHGERNATMSQLAEAGVATRPGTLALHTLSYYRDKYGLRPADFPNAFLAEQLSFALPLYAQMTEAEQDYVISHLRLQQRDSDG